MQGLKKSEKCQNSPQGLISKCPGMREFIQPAGTMGKCIRHAPTINIKTHERNHRVALGVGAREYVYLTFCPFCGERLKDDDDVIIYRPTRKMDLMKKEQPCPKT